MRKTRTLGQRLQKTVRCPLHEHGGERRVVTGSSLGCRHKGVRERTGKGTGGFFDKQRMKSTPPLLSSNRFACLEVQEYIDDSPDMPELPVVQRKPTEPRTKRRKWEKTLPKEYHLASTPG